MSPHPIPGLAATLRDGRQYVLDSVHGVSEEQARRAPAPGRWSVLDCLEHLTFVEGRFQEWVLNGTEITPDRNVDREITLYQMLLEARASEHSSRMVAMKNATDNAKQIIKDLTLEYNKVRQASITTEILEIATAQMVLG